MDEKELVALELDDAALSAVFGGAAELDSQMPCAAEGSYDEIMMF